MDLRDAAKVLQSEVEWLTEAVNNNEELSKENPNDPSYQSDEYRKGVRAMIGWVKFHADNPHLLEKRGL